MQIDVCNGDADGLCAVVQWRLHDPAPARLLTGLKREIELLQRVRAAAGDSVLVCDLSLRRNHQALVRLLSAGVNVHYFDHHAPGEIPAHPLLQAHIDTASSTCTSLLVNRFLNGQFQTWALVGAFGDNLSNVARRTAQQMGLSEHETQALQDLGEAINYNAYGDSVHDVHLAPAHLYRIMMRYADPLTFVQHETIGQEIIALRQHDLQQARALQPYRQTQRAQVYLLPDAVWSRRVIGSLGNALASAATQRAHALLKATATGEWVVSVRAPLSSPCGAENLCRAFGGDGRAAAAGIDRLPATERDRFIAVFMDHAWEPVGQSTPQA